MDGILIVADDLTGALDTAGVLRRQGFSSSVVLDAPRLAAQPGVRALALTTETRHLGDPRPTLRDLAPALPAGRGVYKKIDSTLRGAFGVELAALHELLGAATTAVIPALPAQGRQLIDGTLIVDGASTGIHLPTLLHEQTGMPAGHVALDIVRSGPDAIRGRLETAAPFVVLDAASDQDLRSIAEALRSLDRPMLLAGSAGFAAWLPIVWALRPDAPPYERVNAAAQAPILYVFGSANLQTHRQLDRLVEAGVARLDLQGEQLDNRDAVVAACLGTLRERGEVALSLARGPDLSLAAVPPERQRRLAAQLGEMTRRIVDVMPEVSLVSGGGDTVYAICRALAIGEIVLDGEVLAGLPLGHATIRDGRSLRLVTKAGGFGAADALLEVRSVLRGVPRRAELASQDRDARNG